MSPRWRRFRSGPDDTLIVSLAPEEIQLLSGLPEQLRDVLQAPPDDPGTARLFPRAYLDPTEEEAEAEYTAIVGADLLRQRLDALDLVTSSFVRAVPDRKRAKESWVEIALTPDDVAAWLGVLNDLRLVLGTRLEITEDGPVPDICAPRRPGVRRLPLAHLPPRRTGGATPRLTRPTVDGPASGPLP